MLKIALCDDQPTALNHLKNLITTLLQPKKLPFSINLFLNGESLLATPNYYDVIFLDINMSGLNGLETATALRQQNNSCALVFVTALKEYVFDAFEVEPINYLLKPISQPKLAATLDKILQAHTNNQNDFLLIQNGTNLIKIKLANIYYAEVNNHKTFIHTKQHNAEVIQCNQKIEALANQLQGDFCSFFQCHRSYILNLAEVSGYNDGLATLTNGEKIPVAKRRHSDFSKALLLQLRKEVR